MISSEQHNLETVVVNADAASNSQSNGQPTMPLDVAIPEEQSTVGPPPFPDTLEKLEVSLAFLTELALKTVSLQSDCTTAAVAERMRLGMMNTESLLQRLTREKMIEIRGIVGLHNHRYAMLERGWAEVNRITDQCSYVGPAPVSLKSYCGMVARQARSRLPVTLKALDAALANLVLSDVAKQTLGLVASSGRSLFLSGPSGNGKTDMARALVNALGGYLWIPHAIEVDGQVIRVYDSQSHCAVPPAHDDYDHRWVKIRPPLVVLGGELTIESMDLTRPDTQHYYEAPFQMKSNGGVLVVDDLGRQRCSARELLNRWIIPLESRIDYLTLHTGKKIEVPFEQIVVFATNLTEQDIVDEAFLRRMGYRLHIGPPTPEIYRQIFIRYAHSRGLRVEEPVIASVLERYSAERRVPKCCEPRDLIDRAIDWCRFQRQEHTLSVEIINTAWNHYFGTHPNGSPPQP